MCTLVRQQQAQAATGGVGSHDGMPASRPRWGHAAAATLVAVVAAAALVVPSGQRELREADAAGAPAVPGMKTVDVGANATPVAARTVLPVDDGVPTAPDASRAAATPCQHGL